jgi:hypothetical protein
MRPSLKIYTPLALAINLYTIFYRVRMKAGKIGNILCVLKTEMMLLSAFCIVAYF